MKDALLIQQADGPHVHLLNLTIKDHAAYCLRHGIDYWPIYGSALTGKDAGRHAFWNKVCLLLKGLEAGYERVIWLDSDCYIAEPDADIRAACPENAIGMVWHGKGRWPEGPQCYDHYNAGAVYIGNGPDALRLLKLWWKSPDDGHDWHDQHAFNRHALPDYEALVKRYPPIVRLGLEWNSVPFFPFNHERPIVAAWHGYEYDLEKRADAMRAFIANNTLRRMLEHCDIEEAQQKADYCMHVGNFAGAVAFFERADELGAGTTAEFYYRYAHAFTEQKQHAQALPILEKGQAIEPENGLIYQFQGMCYDVLGEHRENGKAIAMAQRFCPNFPPLMHNVSLWKLRNGDWREGFDLMKWSYLCRERIPRYPGVEWDGNPNIDKVYVWAEQGLGDTLMLSRYLPMVMPHGYSTKVMLEVQQPLLTLMQAQCWPGVEVVARPADNSMPWEFDAHIGMFTLPNVIGATVENTSGKPYLKAPADKALQWFDRLRPRQKDEIRIGFSWAGSAAHGNNHNRNAEASLFDSIVKTPGTCWYSLQRDIEIPQEAKDATPEVTWIGDEFADMADTAGALANLDLVITIDSAIAHLCGALGIPCWVMLSKSSDWRWLLDRDTTVWYDSVKLYRQETLGDWLGVMERIEADLKELVNDAR